LDRSYAANTLIALSVTVTTWALWSLGESRVDAYIALYTLAYTVIKSLLEPRRKPLDIPWLILLAMFTVAVSYRVLEVLGWI